MRLDVHGSVYGHAGDPLRYPGDRPAGPYFVSGATASPLSWDWDLSAIRLDDGRRLQPVLAENGATPLEERVVQVAFGGNRDLANLAWKFRSYRLDPATDVSADVVTLPGYIDDADVVACNIGYWGYVYAGLVLHRPPLLNRHYVHGNRVPVTVLLLDETQMQATHMSEGVPRPGSAEREHVTCDVGVLDVHTLGRTLKAQVYGLPVPFLSLDGGRLPVGLERVATECATDRVPRLDQRAIWTGIVERLRGDLEPFIGGADADDVVDLIRAGAAHRMSGGPGSGDRGQRLFEAVRQGILDKLALIDEDGRPATGCKHLPGALSTEDSWKPEPALGPQLKA